MAKKIGEDVIGKKRQPISAKPQTPEEEEEYQRFVEGRKKVKPVRELKSKMPEDKQPSDEQLVRQREKDYAELGEYRQKRQLPKKRE